MIEFCIFDISFQFTDNVVYFYCQSHLRLLRAVRQILYCNMDLLTLQSNRENILSFKNKDEHSLFVKYCDCNNLF